MVHYPPPSGGDQVCLASPPPQVGIRSVLHHHPSGGDQVCLAPPPLRWGSGLSRTTTPQMGIRSVSHHHPGIRSVSHHHPSDGDQVCLAPPPLRWVVGDEQASLRLQAPSHRGRNFSFKTVKSRFGVLSRQCRMLTCRPSWRQPRQAQAAPQPAPASPQCPRCTRQQTRGC